MTPPYPNVHQGPWRRRFSILSLVIGHRPRGSSPGRALSLAGCATLIGACASNVPETHYYRLALETPQVTCRASNQVLSIGEITVDAGYNDDRIAYRESPYQLSYYYYHRWVTEPAQIVADALRNAYAASECFARIEDDPLAEADVILTGRVRALEEVDRSSREWLAHLALDLQLVEAAGGRVLWSRHLDVQRPAPRRHPEGVAAAMSALMTEVVEETAPVLAQIAQEHSTRSKAGLPD